MTARFNEDHYVLHMGGGTFALDLICLRCGAHVYYPAADAPEPTTVQVHDVFHERMQELWVDLLDRQEREA